MPLISKVIVFACLLVIAGHVAVSSANANSLRQPILLRANDSMMVHIPTDTVTPWIVKCSAFTGRCLVRNDSIIYYSPDHPGTDSIRIKIEKHGSHTGKDTTIMVLVYKQFIILKADDLVLTPEAIVPSSWMRFISYIDSQNIAASIGVVGCSLVHYTPAAAQYLNKQEGCIEFWNHGYSHKLDSLDTRTNTKYHEFYKTPFSYQLDHIKKTQELAARAWRMTFYTFGAPGNAFDSTTMQCLDRIDEIKIWLLGDRRSKKCVLTKQCDIESPLGRPNYDYFIKNYTVRSDYLILQFHPNQWDSDGFRQFREIIDYLKQNQATFIKPYDYYRLLTIPAHTP